MDAFAKVNSVRDLLSLVDKHRENNDPKVLGALIETFHNKIQKLEKNVTDPQALKNRVEFREILLNSNHEHHKACVQDLFVTYSEDCADKMVNSASEQVDGEKTRHGKSKKGGSRKKNATKSQVKKEILAALRKAHKTMPQKAAWVLEQADLEIKEMKEDLECLRHIKETLENLLQCYNEEHAKEQSVSPVFEENEDDNFCTEKDNKIMTEPTEMVIKNEIDSNACDTQHQDEEEGTETRIMQEQQLLDCGDNTNDELHFDNDNEADRYEANFSAFCRSIGHSTDINGNLVKLSTQHKTHSLVKPQLHELHNPNDPNLQCSTCERQIDNACSLYYCRPCQRVRICDNKKCAILHHCKIRKPKAFCICGQDAMFLCKRCETKACCSNTCQKNDWKRHKVNECQLPLID